MKLTIWSKASAPIEQVKKIAHDQFVVWVREPTHEGRTDRAILRLLADYLKISFRQIRFVSNSPRIKIVEI
jgi:uncharacterized protein YggU (UPF0235/DUF167 family)